jgi:hypothetical protein
MIPEERLELLMQRAVDRELAPAQRRELLEILNQQPEGWKQLGCAFLEEQLVGTGVRGAATLKASNTEPDSTVTPSGRQTAFWYQHPILSTAVTICLAFALGLAIPVHRTVQQPAVAGQTVSGGQPVKLGNGSVGSDRDEQLRDEIQTLLRTLESFSRSGR